MAYLHCHNCNWSQDDFWHESYNPISFIDKNYKETLMQGNLDRVIESDNFYRDKYIGKTTFTSREDIAREFENAARRIRKMEYRTEQEYKQLNPEQKCPNCGKKELDID